MNIIDDDITGQELSEKRNIGISKGITPSHILDVKGIGIDVKGIGIPKAKFREILFIKIIKWYLCKKHYSFIINKGWSEKKGAAPNEPLIVYANGIIDIET